MKCINCNKEIADGSLFCGYCGSKSKSEEAPKEQPCKKCGIMITINSKFCKSCGTKVEEDVAETFTAVSAQVPQNQGHSTDSDSKEKLQVNVNYGEKSKNRKKGVGILVSVLLIIFMGSGGFCGYYVAKNGWDAVPFVEKLGILQFINIEEANFESFAEAAEEVVIDEKEDEKAKDSKQEQTDIIGCWIYETDHTTQLIHLMEDNTFMFAKASAEELGLGQAYFGKYSYNKETKLIQMELSSEETGAELWEAEALTYGNEVRISINTGGSTTTYLKVMTTNTDSLIGKWEPIGGNGEYIIFNHDGAVVSAIEDDTPKTYAYNYDAKTRTLVLNDHGTEEVFRIDFMGGYAVMSSQEKGIMLKRK